MAGSGVSSAARCRNAAAAASPPRPCARSAERAISAATASSGVAVACARCHARRSGSSDRVGRVGERPVHVAAVARVRRAVDRRADERMRKRTRKPSSINPAASAGRRPRRRSRAARRRATAGSHRPAARPPPSGAAAACRAEASRRAGGSCCSMRLASGRASGSPNPPASSAGVNPRGSSISASGLPRGLVEDPGPHPLVERPGDRRVEQQPGIVGGEPFDHELRQPVERVPVAGLAQREHQTHPLGQAAGAPRTRASAPTPGRATARRRRCTRAAAPRRRRRAGSAPPARRGSGPAAGRRSGRTPCSARRAAGSGRCSRRPSIGAHSACRPANASSISDSTPAARAIRHPSAARRQVPQQGGLADARLAAEDQHAALARPHARDEPLEHVALAVAVEQPGR